MNVLDSYKNRVIEMYKNIHPDIDAKTISLLASQFIDERIKSIPCQMHNNITRELIDTNMLSVFDYIENRDPIITGNATLFKQHEEYLSPTVRFVETLESKRDKEKTMMYTFDPGTPMYNNWNGAQLSTKQSMNSDYGGAGSLLSPFYSCYIPPCTTGSAKNVTTSLICCLEFLSMNNNFWAKLNGINELFDMIFIVLNDDRTDRVLIHDTYSVHEVSAWLLSRMNNVTNSDKRTLNAYLSSLSNDELTKIMLAFNIRLVLRKYLYGAIKRVSDYFKEHQVDPDNISKETLHECGYGKKPPECLISDFEEICRTIIDNCVYGFIPNDAEVRAEEMEDREIVCVTDTDSLMVHFANYIDEFQSDVGNHIDSCIIASAIGMRIFIEHVIPTMVKYIAANSNIKDPYYASKIVFKNEYGMLAMCLIAKKMYASSMFVQEGNPRNPHKIAVSGLSFKKRDSAEFLEPIMIDIYDKYILTGKRVDISGVLDVYVELRNKLLDELSTSPQYYSVLSIKDIDSYDKNKTLPAQMRGAIIWNNLVPDEIMMPMDRVRVIPLSFKLLEEHSNEYSKTSEILRLSLIGYEENKKKAPNPYICIPEHYKEIPEWIRCVIDVEFSVDKTLMPFRQLLDAFDVYVAETPGGFIPSRMVFI